MNNNYLEQKKNSHLYFRVGENNYAINTENVLEIMKLPTLDYPQKLPNNIVGLLKYNNFVINVVDIRFYLNIEVTPYNANNELLIVKTDEAIFGIITDKIIGILPFETSLVDQIPFVDTHMIIEALYRNNQNTVFIVNVYAIESLFKSHDTECVDYDIMALYPQDEASKAIMDKRAEDMSIKSAHMLEAGGRQAKNKYISLNLNTDYYCIALDYIKEILKDVNITNVPGTPEFIEGIINLRGDYITVINLKKFLGLPNNSNTPGKNSIIIINGNDMLIALLVDKINELFEYEEINQETQIDSYYGNQFVIDNILYTILGIDKIFSDKRIVVTDM